MKAPPPRRMGVFLDNLTTSSVIKDSVAEKAGLKAGDVFVEVDGKKLKDRRALINAIQRKGSSKAIKIRRAKAEMDLVMEWPKEKSRSKKTTGKKTTDKKKKPIKL